MGTLAPSDDHPCRVLAAWHALAYVTDRHDLVTPDMGGDFVPDPGMEVDDVDAAAYTTKQRAGDFTVSEWYMHWGQGPPMSDFAGPSDGRRATIRTPAAAKELTILPLYNNAIHQNGYLKLHWLISRRSTDEDTR